MQFFKNAKIQNKLIICLGSLVVVIVVGFGLTLSGMRSMDRACDDVGVNWMPSILNANDLKSSAIANRRTLSLHVLNTDEAKMSTIENALSSQASLVQEAVSKATQLASSDEERRLVEQIKNSVRQSTEDTIQVLALSKLNKNEEAAALLQAEVEKHFTEQLALIENLIDINQKGASSAVQIASQTADSSFIASIASLVVVIIAAVAICLVLIRSISIPLKSIAKSAQTVANGEINVDIAIDTNDEVGEVAKSFRAIIQTTDGIVNEIESLVTAANQGQLSERSDASRFCGAYARLVSGLNGMLDAVSTPIDEAVRVLDDVAKKNLQVRMNGNYSGTFHSIKQSLNSAIDGLNEALSQVAVGAEQVNAASGQIATGSQSLAQGASQQASALADISASMEEMSSSTKQNADNAAIGRTLAEESKQAVQQGSDSMLEMGVAINKIKESSDATAKIVKTIDDIAFQTNLLALNAAVEAARAGDAGKGFAVVAEEVRNLAQRSAEAAKTTANLIEESVRNSDGGVSITRKMSEILARINDGAQKVNDIICEIAAASKQQSSGIEQVNSALTNLDKLTQETAANSEESASAGEELNAQASSLATTVAEFQLAIAGRSTPVVLSANTNTSENVPKRRSTVASASHSDNRTTKSNSGSTSKSSKSNGNKVLVPLDDDDFRGF